MINHPAQDARKALTFRQIVLLILTLVLAISLIALLMSIQFAYPRLQKEHADRLAAQGDYPAALAVYAKYAQADGSQQGWKDASLAYAVSLFDQQQYDQADAWLASLNKAAQDMATQDKSTQDLANQGKSTQDMATQGNAALDKNVPDQAYLDRVMYWRGRCAESDGRYRSAAGFYQQCLSFTEPIENRTGSSRYLEVSMLLAREYEAEGKRAQAYNLYDALSDDVPEAAATTDSAKSQMRASFLLLRQQFDQALKDLRFADAADDLQMINDANETFASYFGDSLVSCSEFDRMTFAVIRTEKDTQIRSWLDRYDQALANQNTRSALAAIQAIDRINTACQEETGSYLISADELQQKHDVAARQALGANLIDQLNTDQVGSVTLKLGRTPEAGEETSLVPPGADFGLSIVNIKTELTLQVRWYRREIPYLESDLTETLILESPEMAWQPGISWYAWAETADVSPGGNAGDNTGANAGENTGFIPGYYAVDLLAKHDNGEEERIGRTYFQILDGVPQIP